MTMLSTAELAEIAARPTMRSLIFDEAAARLKLIPGVNEVEILPAGDPVSFNAIHLFDGGHRVVPHDAWTVGHDMTLIVEGYVEGAMGVDAHRELASLHAVCVAALVSEPPLGGLAETIDEGDLRIAVAPLASKPRLAFAADFQIGFATRRGDPTAQ